MTREEELESLNLYEQVTRVSPHNIISFHLFIQERYVDIHGFQTRHFPRIAFRGGFTLKEQELIDIWFEHMA